MNYSVGKAGPKAASVAAETLSQRAKAAPSKFDSIRSDLAAQLASQLQPPDPARVTHVERRLLENDLRQRLQKGGGTAAVKSVEEQAGVARTRLDDLKQAVSRLPETDAFAPLRQRVKSIEAEYLASGKLLKELPQANSPEQLMKVQMQMYQVTQNLEMMSRMVDQLTSGVKTVLQTNVG